MIDIAMIHYAGFEIDGIVHKNPLKKKAKKAKESKKKEGIAIPGSSPSMQKEKNIIIPKEKKKNNSQTWVRPC